MALSLEKKAEKVKLQLKKMGVPDSLIARVKFMLDCSGSAIHMFDDGTMQELTDTILPIGMRFDDNASIEMYAFGGDAAKLEDVTEKDFGGYIRNKYIPQASSAGVYATGTDWASPAKLMQEEDGFSITGAVADVAKQATGVFNKFKGLFGKTEAPAAPVAPVNTSKQLPSFVVFVTDGENYGNTQDFINIIRATAGTTYWKLIGVGRERDFDVLKKIAEDFDNVGFASFANLRSQNEDSLYSTILDTEATTFLKRFA